MHPKNEPNFVTKLLLNGVTDHYNNETRIVVTKEPEPMTPSLANFFFSLLAGILVVVIPVIVGLVFISQKDKIQRS